MPVEELDKELGLFAVFCISTGAMFSSGFFLLPGLVAIEAGHLTVWAYLLAGAVMLPAVLSMAELASSMPHDGGAYYFLHRSFGPLIGTIAGISLWIILVLKSAFALVGMGAYLQIFVPVAINAMAAGLTVALLSVNWIGAHESARLQNSMVTLLLAVMAYYLLNGMFSVAESRAASGVAPPDLPVASHDFLAAVAMIFIAYTGVTKVASLAEEIRRPERNIPLGMVLALLVTTTIYAAGVWLMTVKLPLDALRQTMVPAADTMARFTPWLPVQAGILLIVLAAAGAFVSTANAGIMSASRYPLAMARDDLWWHRFARLGRFRTPTAAIAGTGVLVLLAIFLLDVERLAKLASAFQLLLFAALHLAILRMRSRGDYHPRFTAPGYPWIQVIGTLGVLVLLAFVGLDALALMLGFLALGTVWYYGFRLSRHRGR